MANIILLPIVGRAICLMLGLLLVYSSIENCNRRSAIASQDSLINGTLYAALRSYDTTSLFLNLSNNVILKGYTDLESNALTFRTATSAYTQSCGNTSSLENLRSLWRSNATLVKEIEIVQFGPAIQGGYYELIDPWGNSYLSNPPDTVSINAFIAGSTTINTTNIASLNKLQRGMPAIEYLLFDDGNGNSSLASICSNLTSRRLTFLSFLVSDYYTNVLSLRNAWSSQGGNFANELPTAGLGSSFFESKKSALDTLITQMVTVLNNIVDKKLGYPAGLNVSSNGLIRSSAVESRYADASVSYLLSNLKSIQSFYSGNGGAGISEYVKNANPILDRKISSQIEDAITKTILISNLRSQLSSSDLVAIRDAYNAIRTLRTTLTTDLSSLSGTGTTTTTGDGD